MIKFKKVTYQNFFSTGNSPITFDLNKHSKTLIVGKNGAGKSTVCESICFALFGKPYRNINKPQVVNSINKKNCLVEIEFDIGRKKYKVVRGIKPNIFEIYVDGVLLNQDAASKDYQKVLEDSILKMNYKSFTQIVILGMASFTPFMQLPAAARREIIEELLDIKIFTAMNQVLKDKITALKGNIQNIDNKISLAKRKAEIQQDYIKQLETDRDSRLQELVDKKKTITAEIRHLRERILSNEEKKETLIRLTLEKGELVADLANAIAKKKGVEIDLDRLTKDMKFYHESSVCPKCKQGIDHVFKEQILGENKTAYAAREKDLDTLVGLVESLSTQEQEFRAHSKELQEINVLIAGLRSKSETLSKQVTDIKQEYTNTENRVDALDAEQNKLKELAKEALSLLAERGKYVEDQHYHDIAAVMLKDNGVKTRVIRQYLPAINSLVNKYLTTMDFFVQFTLDEKFDEVIKSRHRDDFSYESFSEGQKQRIDLALLFTWRQIAKLKNSANTNLLILDEVFDSSLDDEGTEHVMTLMDDLGKGTNLFVISHKGEKLKDKFKKVVQFELHNQFSVMT